MSCFAFAFTWYLFPLSLIFHFLISYLLLYTHKLKISILLSYSILVKKQTLPVAPRLLPKPLPGTQHSLLKDVCFLTSQIIFARFWTSYKLCIKILYYIFISVFFPNIMLVQFNQVLCVAVVLNF